MFPIRNDHGDVIAFSGRLLDPNAKTAKYLNSPETAIFSKSKVLFGLDRSKRAIIKAGRAIVCEGQIDLITAFEHGFENVVAPLGTAFTEFHARMLKRHAEEVVLCFDSDNAGHKAAERAFAILAPTGLIVKVAPLPQGEDPDSLIRGKGPDAFAAQIAGARDFFDHMLDFVSANRDLNDTREKTRFSAEAVEMIALLDNSIARDAAIQKIALRIGVPEADFRRQVTRALRSNASSSRRESSDVAAAPGTPLPPQDKTSLLLMRLALADAEVLQWLRGTGRAEILRDISGCELLAQVWNSSGDLTDASRFNAFLTTLSREEETALLQLLSQPMPAGGRTEAEQALEALEVKRLENLVQRAQLEMKQTGVPAAKMLDLQKRFVVLRQEYLDRRARLQDIARLPAK